MTARGIRNNNPGNLRHGEDWLGLAPVQDDQNFCIFTEMHFGVRALLKTLRTYVERRGCDTVRKIITRWAPENENDTASYVLHVATACRRDPDEGLNFEADPLLYLDIAKAIARHECGVDAEAITDDVWEVGLKEAGL